MKSYRILGGLGFVLVMMLAVICVVSVVPMGTVDVFGCHIGIQDGFTGLSMAWVLPAGFQTKNSVDMKAEKRSFYDKATALNELIKTEKRNFTADEQTAFDDHMDAFEKIGEEVARCEKRERQMASLAGVHNADTEKVKEAREMSRYSVTRAINLRANNMPLDGFEKELHDEAGIENRNAGIKNAITGIGIPVGVFSAERRAAQTVTGGAPVGSEGGFLVATELRGFIDTLRSKLCFGALGVDIMGGLVGNISIPKKLTNTTGQWVDENEELVSVKTDFTQLLFKPKRLGSESWISKQLLAQTSYGVENLVKNDILRTIALAVEAACISGAAAGKNPVGILSQIAPLHLGANGAALTHADIVMLETLIFAADAEVANMAYLTNPMVRGKLKTTKVDAGSGLMVMDKEGSLNGYKSICTNQVPRDLVRGTGVALAPIIFGNWGDLVVAHWGAIDLIVDPITKASANLVKVIANSYWDAGIRNEESFAAFDDVISA